MFAECPEATKCFPGFRLSLAIDFEIRPPKWSVDGLEASSNWVVAVQLLLLILSEPIGSASPRDENRRLIFTLALGQPRDEKAFKAICGEKRLDVDLDRFVSLGTLESIEEIKDT